MIRKRVLILAACGFIAGAATPAVATFHLMQIEQVIGGVNGDHSAQAIQLRMRASTQQFVALARLIAWDAQGLNPLVLIDFASNVSSSGCGRRVLITSPNFNTLTNPTTDPDFTMTNLIPASYLPAGSITYECDSGLTIYWRLSWGGNAYTGPTTGSITNDGDGDFGPPWPGPLPLVGVQALQFQGACSSQSTTNADDYALTDGAAVFTNNAGDSFTVTTPPPKCPWDLEDSGDVGVKDLLLLLGVWGLCPPKEDCPADFDDSGDVGVKDLLSLLGNWGPCP